MNTHAKTLLQRFLPVTGLVAGAFLTGMFLRPTAWAPPEPRFSLPQQDGAAAPATGDFNELARRVARLETSDRSWDRAAFILDTAAFALIILSIGLGVAAIFGWGYLREAIRRDVLDESRGSLEQTKSELEGRLSNAAALVLGRLSRQQGNYIDVERRDLLEKALEFAQSALDKLEKAQSDHRWSALNNVVFYQALREDPTAAHSTLGQAEQLHARFLSTGREFHFLTTFVRAVGAFASRSDHPLELIRKAEDALGTVLSSPVSSERERAEAKSYQAWLGKVRRRLEAEARVQKS